MNARGMSIEERNIYVDDLIERIRNGDEKSKVELFNIVIKLFRTKTFNDRCDVAKDLEQDLYFEYEKALGVYNHSSPFLSFIHNYFGTIYYSKLPEYDQPVYFPKYAQKKLDIKAKSEMINDDYDYGQSTINLYEDKIHKEHIQLQTDIILNKLTKEIDKIIIKLKFGIIPMDDKPTYDAIKIYLYDNGYTKKELTRQAIEDKYKRIMNRLKDGAN